MAEGLHLVDFEQLKIENSTLHEKIEERNEELQKFVKKTTKTVQVLTHMKEKLQFVNAKRKRLRQNISELELGVASSRDRLNGLKAERDLRKRRSKEKDGDDLDGGGEGGGNHDDMIPRSLLRDYQDRAKKIIKMKRRVEKLKRNFESVKHVLSLRETK